MNLSDVKTRVKRQFGDESAVQVTDADITRWVNDSQRMIVLNNEGLLEQTFTQDLIANQQSYPLPADCLIFKGASMKVSQGLSYFQLRGYPIQQFNSYMDGWDGTAYGPGTPAIFTIFDSTFILFPIPDTTATLGLKFFYSRSPVDVVNDADLLDLPVVYHNAVVNYCIQQAYELDEDWQAFQAKGAEFQQDVKLARNREPWPVQETYSTVTILPDDMW